MKAILLSAGLGSRLTPLTNKIPKPLIKIGNRSNLERNLERFQREKIKEIYINVHHLSHKIVSTIGSGDKYGVSIKYSFEKTLLGTAGAIKSLEQELKGDLFLVLYADNYIDVNLNELIEFHKNKQALITIVLFEDYFAPQTSGIVELNSEEQIIKIIDKPKKIFSNWADAGIYVFEPKVLKFITSRGESSITKDLFPFLLEQREKIFGYKTDKEVISLDTPEKLKHAKDILNEKI